jgi:hypothetical protein
MAGPSTHPHSADTLHTDSIFVFRLPGVAVHQSLLRRNLNAPLNGLTFSRILFNFGGTKQSLPEAQNKNGGHGGPL